MREVKEGDRAYVLQLQIAMCIALRVDIEQRVHYAAKDFTSSAFVQAALLGNEFKEIAPTTVLEEQIHEQVVLIGLEAQWVYRS